MPPEKLKPTYIFTEDRLAELRAVVPEAFADGKIEWETLREALGEWMNEEDASTEHYGLNWPGKREARRLAAKPSHGTLAPAPGEGIDEETTGNIYIEGDNLEVLKLLQKSYAGRIKMIYIDPPYNTGSDFVYKDDFSEPLESYLRRTGQSGERGELLTSNPKSSGRFHTNWLNMMYPRLRIARTLLRDDGVIFVSIDDHEILNLRALMDELFGEENFIATIVWQKVFAKKNKAIISGSHDYIVVYTRQVDNWARKLFPRDDTQLSAFVNPDSDPRGLWQSVAFSVQSEDSERRKAYRYVITLPSGRRVLPPPGRHWNGLESRFDEMKAQNRLWFGANGDSPPRQKVFLSEVQDGIVPDTWWRHEDAGNNQEAKKEILELFQNDEPFNTPKPTRLIKRLLAIAVEPHEQDIVLDFFSGSGTTADAVLQTNHADRGNRRFILVQCPEPTKDAKYPTISHIGMERIRRVITNIKLDKGLDLRETPADIGFKVYKLAASNFTAWHDYQGESLTEIQSLFDQHETPLVAGWDAGGLLTEILLLEGFPLDSHVSRQPLFSANVVFSISSSAVGHHLWVCLDPKVERKTLDTLDISTEDVFICLDSALTDDAKLHLTQAGMLRTI